MKKQTILAFTAALGIAMSVSAPVEAASVNRVNILVFEKDCTPELPKDDVTETSYAKQVLKLVNAERKKAGLNELVWDETVATAAMTRSKEIEKSFSHTRPDGRGFWTAITDLGITYRGAGENIAWGQKTPEAVMNAWMNSEGHRANILNPNFKKIGVGYRTNSQGTTYWTQLFTY